MIHRRKGRSLSNVIALAIIVPIVPYGFFCAIKNTNLGCGRSLAGSIGSNVTLGTSVITTEDTGQVQDPVTYTHRIQRQVDSELLQVQLKHWDEVDQSAEPYSEPPFTEDEVIMLAKTVWGEAGDCPPEEQRLVVWTVLQRVDADGEFRNDNTIKSVITKKGQFAGYRESHPVNKAIYELCRAELANWWLGEEPPAHEIYAPTTPYYFFDGDGKHNWFRRDWK